MEDAEGRRAERYWQLRSGEVAQPDMVAVAVAEDEREEIAAAVESFDRWVTGRVVCRGVEWQAEVEEEPGAIVGEFDAGAADLARAAVNAHPHRDPACPARSSSPRDNRNRSLWL
ncbi:hypothetical protein Maq22A_c14365 [Methylobacterium aquaticum]|uniref:Uncharacterized protein n=1 Tax=Methylobacterium aquaticum TaxID=270351 RepID=A0A0C6FG91_9HYPH|nr:hypothetical protein Maq22A_c14365 [Methylobacterium aquaticum]